MVTKVARCRSCSGECDRRCGPEQTRETLRFQNIHPKDGCYEAASDRPEHGLRQRGDLPFCSPNTVVMECPYRPPREITIACLNPS
jgi:hypothetical protein